MVHCRQGPVDDSILWPNIRVLNLRTVPTFATAHTFCASRCGPPSDFLTVVPAKTEIFLRGL